MKRKGYAQSNQIFAKISLCFYAVSLQDWTYKITRAIILFISWLEVLLIEIVILMYIMKTTDFANIILILIV